jgi:hypothetical protein
MHNVGEGAVGENQGSGSTASGAGDQQIIIERLGNHHKIAEFVCSPRNGKSPNVQRFLREQALKYEQLNFARIFIASPQSDPTKVFGYYSLSAASLSYTKLSTSQQKKGPGHIDYPMVKLGYMGRADDISSGRKLGPMMLVDAAQRVNKIACLGIWGFVLDAEVGKSKNPANDKLVKWYEEHGFQKLPDQPPGADTIAMFARLKWLLPES